MLAIHQELTIDQRLTKAYIDIMNHLRYMALGPLLLHGKRTIVDDPSVTARTNGRDIEYGRQFIESLDDYELRFLILHEVYHKLFRHLTTWKNLHDKNFSLANQACDYNINGKLVTENKEDGFATMPRTPDGKMIGLYDDRFRAGSDWMPSDIIFEMLEEDEENGDQQGQPSGGGGQPLDEHDWEGAADISEEEAKEIEAEIEEAIRQGQMMAETCGGEKNVNIDELLKPQVNWRDVLREFIETTCSGADYSTWKRPNRRYIGANVYLPSGISETAEELLIACDMSGSVGPKERRVFLSEVVSICEVMKPQRVRIVYWGSIVPKEEVYEAHEVSEIMQRTQPVEGYGTDIDTVTAYMQANNVRPTAAIVLTDGDFRGWGQWHCPVLWALVDNESHMPDCGKVVRIKARDLT